MTLLSSDPRLVRALKTLDDMPLLPLADYVDDAVRRLRAAPEIRPRSREIAAARASIADTRTRLVEAKVAIMGDQSRIEGMRSDLEAYLRNKYSQHLSSFAKNPAARKAMVDDALVPITRRVRKLESARERVEEVIKDFDSRAYAVRDTIAALQLGEREA